MMKVLSSSGSRDAPCVFKSSAWLFRGFYSIKGKYEALLIWDDT